MLALREKDGQWSGGACFPGDFKGDFSQGQPWTSTFPTLTLLRRAEHYLIERKLIHRLLSGEIVNEDFLQFAFPTWWHYDVLRALDYSGPLEFPHARI